MGTRVHVWLFFVASAICLGIQIVQSLALAPGESGPIEWGFLGICCGIAACRHLAFEG
jgi:hypothetical protein